MAAIHGRIPGPPTGRVAGSRASSIMQRAFTLLPAPVSLIIALALLTGISTGGCTSSADYDPAIRRERLLAIYPLGKTSREDVQKRWQSHTPEFTAVRPAEDWDALDNPRVRVHVAGSEKRTGKPVQRIDLYVGPDGWGLCYCWFYYDERDKVLDVEWQHHTD